jgi:tetratricopeptide (TPR) repeat protein
LRGVFGWVAGSPAKSPLDPPLRKWWEIQRSPVQPPLLFNGGPGGILSLFLVLLLLVFTAQAGADSPRDLVALANELYKAGKVVEALESYEKALKLAPDSPEILFDKGNAHFQNGEFEKARDAYGRAALLSENGALKAKAHFNLGCAATSEAIRDSEKAGKKSLALLDVAVMHYKEALRLDSNYRSEAGRGIESARLSILQIREKIQLEAEGAADLLADGPPRNRDVAERTENASEQPPSGNEIQKGTEEYAGPQEIGSQGPQITDATREIEALGEPLETPADILHEEAENSETFRRSFYIGDAAGRNW